MAKALRVRVSPSAPIIKAGQGACLSMMTKVFPLNGPETSHAVGFLPKTPKTPNPTRRLSKCHGVTLFYFIFFWFVVMQKACRSGMGFSCVQHECPVRSRLSYGDAHAALVFSLRWTRRLFSKRQKQRWPEFCFLALVKHEIGWR